MVDAEFLHDVIDVVQSRQCSEMLKKAQLIYQDRAITTHEVIDERIRLAKEIRDAHSRGDHLGLNKDETAFYDAPTANKSAVDVLGDQQLALIARELVEKVKQNASIDWTIKETVCAKMRVMIRRILKKHGYPPDLQEAATQTVLEQAEVLCAEWTQ